MLLLFSLFYYFINLSSEECNERYSKFSLTSNEFGYENKFRTANTTLICQVLSDNKNEPFGLSTDHVWHYRSEPEPWSTRCNLKHFYTYSATTILNTTYWFPAKRNVRYGPYEFIIFGNLYGRSIENSVNVSRENLEHIFEKNCLILDKTKDEIFPEYCDAAHRHECYFSHDEYYSFCMENSLFCIDERTCFCKISDSLCIQMADIKTSTKEHDVIPTVDNTFCYLEPSNGNVSSVVNEILYCRTCRKKIRDFCSDTTMVLNFNKHKRELYLGVYSPECMYGGGHVDYLYCFTDASKKLKKRVDIAVYLNSTKINGNTNESNFVVYTVKLENLMGNYWCTAYRIKSGNEEELHSNTVIAYKKKQGTEFAVRLNITDVCIHSTCELEDDFSISSDDFLNEDISRILEANGFSEIRIMEIFNFNYDYCDLLIHLSTISNNNVINDGRILATVLKQLPDYVQVIYSKSSECCLPEYFQNVSWPLARVSQTVLPLELCMQENGLPVTRFCKGNFLYGLEWSAVNGNCSDSFMLNEDTRDLHTYVNQNISENLMKNVSKIVKKSTVTVTDLYFVAEIMKKVSDSPIVDSSMVNISLTVVDNLVQSNLSLLNEAQETLNLTDMILRTTENIANYLSVAVTDIYTFQKDYIIVHSFNPIVNNVSGFVLYKNHSIKHIPLMGDFTDVEEIYNIKVALYIPKEDIQMIVANNVSNVTVVAIIYLNDAFFSGYSNSSANLILNLNIPNYDTYMQSPVPLLVSYDSTSNSSFHCAFWDYGDEFQQKKGNWSSVGSYYLGQFSNYSGLELCTYSHLTHLALLVMDRAGVSSNTVIVGINDSILTVITAVGSLLSLVGIVGIFLTAIVFDSWRNKTGTQILLHLSSATLLEIVFMYMSGVKLFKCQIAGIILQYVVISKFAWMLVYAFCQYLRFVKVFGSMPEHLVIKSIVFGWGIAIIPVLVVSLADPLTYFEDNFCYPNGLSLYLGVYLPVALILAFNLFIFFKVMFEISNSKFDKFHSKYAKLQQVKLAILLFSVLGIPWCFGLLSNVVPTSWFKVVLLYIFTITSIVQGFLMFLFYVVLNKETRDFWRRVILEKQRIYEVFSSKKNQTSTSTVPCVD